MRLCLPSFWVSFVCVTRRPGVTVAWFLGETTMTSRETRETRREQKWRRLPSFCACQKKCHSLCGKERPADNRSGRVEIYWTIDCVVWSVASMGTSKWNSELRGIHHSFMGFGYFGTCKTNQPISAPHFPPFPSHFVTIVALNQDSLRETNKTRAKTQKYDAVHWGAHRLYVTGITNFRSEESWLTPQSVCLPVWGLHHRVPCAFLMNSGKKEYRCPDPPRSKGRLGWMFPMPLHWVPAKIDHKAEMTKFPKESIVWILFGTINWGRNLTIKNIISYIRRPYT